MGAGRAPGQLPGSAAHFKVCRAKREAQKGSYFKTTSSFIEKSLKEKAVPMRVTLAWHSLDVQEQTKEGSAVPCR